MLEDGEIATAGRALERARPTPVRLQSKEGLALINGTYGMLETLVLALEDLDLLLKTADVTTAMSVEGYFTPTRSSGRRSTPSGPTLARSLVPATCTRYCEVAP